MLQNDRLSSHLTQQLQFLTSMFRCSSESTDGERIREEDQIGTGKRQGTPALCA